MNNDIEILGADLADMTARPQQQNGGLLSADIGNIEYLAERADKYIAAMNRVMEAALKITTEYDWVLIGGNPYLQESGATKVARLFGISISLIGAPIVEADPLGYKTYTYKARFMLGEQFVECEGSRSMKEDFFAGKPNKDGKIKSPDEIVERDVRLAAYTNCLNNGIKRLIPGLRNIDIATLEKAGFQVDKIRGFSFKTGSKGGSSGKAEDSGLVCSSCGAAVTQKVASYSEGKFGAVLCMACQKTAGGATE